MAIWVNTGTVSISAGGTTVTGTDTHFAVGVNKGDSFQAPDGREYEITNIISDTQLSIFKAYLGSNVTDSSNWDIIPTQGYVKALVDEVREYVETSSEVIAEIGDTGLSIEKGGTGAKTVGGALANLGLDEVDNTSDLDKPISTATQTALDGKLGITATAADSSKLGGVVPSGYSRVWNVGVNEGTAQWMKLCTISGATTGQKYSFYLSGTGLLYSTPNADTGSSRLDITLLSDGLTWSGSVYRTANGTNGLQAVSFTQIAGSATEIWLSMGTFTNVSALCIGTNISNITPFSGTYTPTAPTATSSAALFTTIQQSATTGIVPISTLGGLTLPNVSNSGTNVLDWYEEGTWTPTIYGSSTAGTASYSVQQGRYTRVGNRVTCSLTLSGTFSTAPSGDVRIGGLPFTPLNISSFACAGGAWYSYGIAGLNISVTQTFTYALLVKSSAGTTGTAANAVFGTDYSSASFNMAATVSYIV